MWCLRCYARFIVYPKKYAHGFVVLCFVVVMQSFIMNSHEVFIYIHQDCFAGTGAIVRSPQCQWSKPDGYGEISQCITTTKHSRAKKPCAYLFRYTVPSYRSHEFRSSFERICYFCSMYAIVSVVASNVNPVDAMMQRYNGLVNDVPTDGGI